MSWIERSGHIRFRRGLTNRDYFRAIWRGEAQASGASCRSRLISKRFFLAAVKRPRICSASVSNNFKGSSVKRKRKRWPSDGWWAAAVALLILLQFWWLPGAPESAGDSYSNTSDGKLGLYRVLSQLWPDVRRESDTWIPDDSRTILLIGPDRYPNPRELEKLRQFVRQGGALVSCSQLDGKPYRPDAINGFRTCPKGRRVNRQPRRSRDGRYKKRPPWNRKRKATTIQ